MRMVMMIGVTLFTLVLSGAVAGASAATGPKTVWFYGDSIATGHGLDLTNDQDPSLLSHIETTAAALAAANGSNIVFAGTEGQDFQQLCYDTYDAKVKPDDDVVFENAGPQFNNATAYRDWLDLWAFCSSKGGIGNLGRASKRLILTTTFDYKPQVPASAYDAPIPGSHGKTVNGVVRAAAVTDETSFLDWNHEMDAARAVLEPQGVRLIWPDGIHPTVWGNILLALSVLHFEGVPVTNYQPVITELMAQQQRIVSNGFAPAGFTATQAQQWLTVLAVDADLPPSPALSTRRK